MLLTIGIRSLIEWARFPPIPTQPVLYPRWEHMTPTLKLFRREPAITRFDWLFTPYHKSSERITRRNGSGLLCLFGQIHPAHGKLTSFRVYCNPSFVRAINTRFRYASAGKPLRQRNCNNSLAHSSIGTPSRRKTSPTSCRCMVSVLFHSPYRGSFHLSLTVLVHYRSLKVFSLTG